ncbi:ClbS/DfsB family four-helix bundle protein [Cohaesibacter celericrescens]|nr:ClbS/DfsB family four-helix bundle protein [Cohaesibacter celericrescens]
MPAATNKDDLIATTCKEFDKLDLLLSALSQEDATWVPPEEEISIRDLVAHRSHWIGLYFRWYEEGKAGKDVQTPAPGYKWNQLKSYNAQIYQAASSVDWGETLVHFRQQHQVLLAHLQALDDATLYTKHLFPWMNEWTLGRWAEASGSSHYRSAAKYVRKLNKIRHNK